MRRAFLVLFSTFALAGCDDACPELDGTWAVFAQRSHTWSMGTTDAGTAPDAHCSPEELEGTLVVAGPEVSLAFVPDSGTWDCEPTPHHYEDGCYASIRCFRCDPGERRTAEVVDPSPDAGPSPPQALCDSFDMVLGPVAAVSTNRASMRTYDGKGGFCETGYQLAAAGSMR